MPGSLDLRDVFAGPRSRPFDVGRPHGPLQDLEALAMEVVVELASFVPEQAPDVADPADVTRPPHDG
ncbi:MAG: hypothetical protein M0P31_05465 [Solirubrobacteraceae bacterium]|nr:hypothetical protein [Solirubrobacteraceae bacterium]